MMVENSDDCTNWIQLKHKINFNREHFEPLEGAVDQIGEIYRSGAGERFGARESFGDKE